MRKYKFFVDLAKEEQWLNEMAAQGYILAGKTGGSYRFESGEPGSFVLRIDYRAFKHAADFEDYRLLFEDSGWQHIAGTKSSGAQYFLKKTADQSEDIFSDADSKAGKFKRLSEMWFSLAVCFLPILTALVMAGNIDLTAFLQPAKLYYTPGLWDKTGADFWGAFLFETPFALLRGFIWLILPVSIVLYAVFAAKARNQYNKTLNK